MANKASAFWNQEEPAQLWIVHRDRANELLMADPSLFSCDVKSFIHLPGGHSEGWPDLLKNIMLNYYSFMRSGKSLLTDKPSFDTFEDGHLSICIMDAILQSHAEGKWIPVNGKLQQGWHVRYFTRRERLV